MNLGGDKMPLFDITSEDDLLIDSQLDRASFDLSLSVAFDEHSRALNARRKEEFKSRQSLAWDTAFFTSPGILDLRELSLVNEGFKNPEDHRSKICEKARKLETWEREATESFLEYRVSGKHTLQTTKRNTRVPTPNIGLASRSRSTQKQEHRRSPCLMPSKLQTRTTGAVLSAENTNPASPRSAFQKNVTSSAYKGMVSSNAGKGWLSKSLEMKGDNQKNMGGGLDLNGIDSPHKWVPSGRNVAQVSDIEGSRKPLHHENSQSEAGNKVQVPSLMKQTGAKAKRSASPLPGDVMNSSKKPSRFRILEADQSASRSAKRVPLLRSISPEPRGRGTMKDYGANGGLKKGEMKTNRHSLTKKVRSLTENDEKENKFCAEIESIPGGLSKEEYVDFTNLFGGLGMEPKGIKRRKASTSRLIGLAPPLRSKAMQSNRDLAVEEAGTKSPLGSRSSAFRTSAFLFKA